MFDLNKKDAKDASVKAEPSREPAKSAEPSGSKYTAGVSAAVSKGGRAVIGPSIQIDGELRGDEDLLIEGQVNGTVQLKNNAVTIGSQGKVKADVHARVIEVEGIMEGDSYGSERVSIRNSAQVRGNVTAPTVSLEDGAKFKGAIEMGSVGESGSNAGNARQNNAQHNTGSAKPGGSAPAGKAESAA